VAGSILDARLPDEKLAIELQHELKVPDVGMAEEIQPLRGREKLSDNEKGFGGSDDIGDVSWNVPTVTLGYPANFEAGPGHNWANGVAMATPIAQKGVTAGAKVQATGSTFRSSARMTRRQPG
jgi:aminobenzoyl-glutamate utilization protein B